MNTEQHSNANDNPNGCDTVAELIPAYAMGMTDPEETALVERMLAHCPQAALLLDEYRDMAAALHFSAPPVTPPPALAGRVLAAVAPVQAPTSADAPAPVTPVSAANIRRWRPLAQMAAAVVLLGLLVYLLLAVVDLRQENAELAATLSARDAGRVTLGTGAVLTFALEAQTGAPADAAATVLCNPASTVAMLHAQNLPALAPGMAYQVWLIRNDMRESAGLFTVGEDGAATLVFEAPLPMGEYSYVGITPEPEAGSAGPTSPAVVRGRLY